MDMISIIEKKKLSKELTKEEIAYWITDYCAGAIPDYQTAALLMAIRLNGMTKKETFALTESMMNSGRTLDLSAITGVKCDKHSTGGVGDKTSLALCPLVASLGIKIAKMSGRGLGFTGGTLDKLESIPGMRTDLNSEEFIDAVNKVGMSIIGQSAELDPADKKLYSLRDVTGTVDSMPLIASSIMSKKLASGSDCILLDVKYGSGAFMPTKEAAEELAKMMVEIGTYFGKDVRAEITSMNQPLGLAIGNILEVKEAIETLHNRGPKDFVDLILSSGTTMLLQAKAFTDPQEARDALTNNLSNGKGFDVFARFVQAQGGDISYVQHPEKFPVALYIVPVTTIKTGYISSIDTMGLGIASMRLGAGRETKDDLIDVAAGIMLKKKLGEYVSKGDTLATIYTEHANAALNVPTVLSCFEISPDPVTVSPVVEEVISLDATTNVFAIQKES